MFKIIPPRFSFLSRCLNKDFVKRFFLSDAYKCEEAWANRLKNPIFQKADLSSLYHELDLCFMGKKRVNVVDVDLLLTGVNDSSYKNELDDVIFRIRQTPECKMLPERSTHAVVRWYLKHAPKEDLLNVLSDRLNYGIFPDYYLNNMMMDKFLKEGDPVTAVKIAVLQMLQEDFDHPIMKTLALHCCYSYLESPDIWEGYTEPEPDPDEEVKKVRVKYLRNPYFDDHFDITNTNHLVGKTLWLFGRTVDGALGTSSQLIGLVLYEKYEKCAEFLQSVIQDGRKIHSEAVMRAREFALKTPKQAEAENSGEGSQEETKTEEGKAEAAVDGPKSKVLKLLEELEKKNLEDGSLFLVSAELVKKAVEENENTDIKHQCEVYKQWEKDREESIQKEIERAHLNSIKSEIENMKEELKEEEERLFFFDRLEDIQLLTEEKEKEKREVVYYKGKGKEREQVLDEYIPPDVSRSK